MHQRQRRFHRGIGQVGEHRLHLDRREHALVYQRARRQARDVKQRAFLQVRIPDRLLDALADHIELALEGHVIGDTSGTADENLPEHGLGRTRRGTERGMIHRNVAPAEQGLPLLAHDGGKPFLTLARLGSIARQEHHAAAVMPGFGQLHTELAALAIQKGMRHLDQDAGAVTGVLLAAAGAAMHEVAQDGQRLRHDLVRAAALHVHHEADATGVVLGGRIIEALLCLTLFQIHSPFPFTSLPVAARHRTCWCADQPCVFSNSPAGVWPGSGKFVLLPAKTLKKQEQKGRKVYRPTPAGSMEPVGKRGL
jgi:hypothetical protein